MSRNTVKTLNFFSDNSPICLQPVYSHVISEGAPTGTLILQVSAYDPDTVAPPQYYLSGNGSDHFALDTSSGKYLKRV